MINLNQVKCEMNRDVPENYIKELAQSIGNEGLLCPLLIREIEQDANGYCYEVMDGRCRCNALMLLKRFELDESDYKIIDSSDPELISFVANMVRQNLSLIEEIYHMAELRERYSPAELASFLGRTEKYIRIRLQLRNLTKGFADALMDEKYPALKLGHYEVISRYPASVQAQLITSYRLHQPGSVDNFEKVLSTEYSHLLATAPFDKTDCEKCLERSLADPWLFEDLKNKAEDRCLNPKCYEQRRVAAVKNELTEIKKEKLQITPITTNYRDLPTGLGKVDCLERSEYDIVEKNISKEKANAYVIDGDGAGTYCRITVHNGAGKDALPKPKTMKQKREDLEKRRMKLALSKVSDYLKEKKNLPQRPSLDMLLKLSALNGLSQRHELGEIKNRKKISIDNVMSAVWSYLVGCFSYQTSQITERTLENIDDKYVLEVCDICGLDWKKFVQEATAEIPEPKGWSEEEGGKKAAGKPEIPEPVKFEIAKDMFVELNNIQFKKKHWECCYYVTVVERSENAAIAGKTAVEAMLNAAECALEFVQDCHPRDRLIEHSRLQEPLLEFIEKQKDAAGISPAAATPTAPEAKPEEKKTKKGKKASK